VNARFGNVVAIVAGDYLMARSAAIAADLGTEVAGLLARTLAWLTRGQVSEVRTAYDVTRTVDDYVEAIGGKTATLMASSCRVGALTSDATRTSQSPSARSATPSGWSSRSATTSWTSSRPTASSASRPARTSARGIYTLPVLVALDDPSVGEELRALLGRPLDEPEREKARSLVASTRGVELALDEGARWAATARAALDGVPEPSLRDGFGALVASLLAEVSAALR